MRGGFTGSWAVVCEGLSTVREAPPEVQGSCETITIKHPKIKSLNTSGNQQINASGPGTSVV